MGVPNVAAARHPGSQATPWASGKTCQREGPIHAISHSEAEASSKSRLQQQLGLDTLCHPVNTNQPNLNLTQPNLTAVYRYTISMDKQRGERRRHRNAYRTLSVLDGSFRRHMPEDIFSERKLVARRNPLFASASPCFDIQICDRFIILPREEF
ncbi:hypothetical protein GX48_03625 [Paracoccidioides brasiliensis]|nr:hypothetical protein GX48_03625 [Paracoccidioides brasiliensis]